MDDITDQEIAINLRKRALLFWLAAAKGASPCTVIIPDSKPVCGTFVAMDSHEQRVRINALQTPIGTYDRVVLRGSDVDALELSM
ncbi:hypothetical protein BX616_000957 [Lobosporangium transversale]|uniref:Uncharacterized protein n=1 Tax=Lobosporangium transversale TaxID=64571 RepID=A0A1Y2GVN3_9FUNG|nr:hypothetical protein BCR41DRAFT_420531 [Lobosporangium transversale]KAF9905672.1 hypothetical protein BX616_000957 [Lobosporangium transversale]ORZ22764.1 hypothetical protein BCR41DRAFT_420531 [Lobosporangium transversale]|eukprot:XP_021883318.1 hypothetical protein BCR41DRAFT_420531 [Lobosporangium transversale]